MGVEFSLPTIIVLIRALLQTTLDAAPSHEACARQPETSSSFGNQRRLRPSERRRAPIAGFEIEVQSAPAQPLPWSAVQGTFGRRATFAQTRNKHSRNRS